MPFYPDQEEPGYVGVGLPAGVDYSIPAPPRTVPIEDDGRPPIMQDALRLEGATGVVEPEPSLWGAAFRQENTVAGALATLGRDQDFGDPDPEHDPLEVIKGTEAEPYWKHFVSSRNTRETQSIMDRISGELADRKKLADSGLAGMGAATVASLLDWPTLLPGGAVYISVRAAEAAAKSALTVGASAAAAAAVQEAALHSQQVIRPWEDTAMAVGGSLILGGILGGGVSAMTSKQFVKLASRLEREMRVPANPADDMFGIGGLRMAQSAGAKAANDLPPVELQGALGLERGLSFQDPVLRTLNNPLRTAREAGTQLFETVLGLTRNAEGVTTAPIGGAAETRIKMQTAKLGEAIEELDRAFADYRFGGPAKMAPARAGLQDMFGQGGGKLSYKAFKEEVGKAMARQDEHAIPEVAKAAKAMRARLIDPLAEQAIKYNLLDPEIVKHGRPGGAASGTPGGGPTGSGGAAGAKKTILRDEAGNITGSEETVGGQTVRKTFTYDAEGRPTGINEEVVAATDEVRSAQAKAAMGNLVDNLERALGTKIDPATKKAMVEALAAGDGTLAKQLTDALEALGGSSFGSAALRDSDARRHIGAFLKMGRPVNVPEPVVGAVHAAFREMGLDPKVGHALVRVEPLKGDPPYPGADILATFRAIDGRELAIPLPWRFLRGTRAFYWQPTGSVVSTRFGAFDDAEQFGRTLAGEVHHEVLHKLRREGSLSGPAWDRLVSHANSLRLLDGELGTYLKMVGDPTADKVPSGVTLRREYTTLYRSEADFAERIDQEAVAHMVELRHHGFLSDAEVAPVRDLLDAIYSGDFARAMRPDGLQNVPGMDFRGGTSITISQEGGPFSAIKAFHGSPHDFEKFDASRIGTGEGAQAYGHGLYFAENEGVARSYRDNLSHPARPLMGAGDRTPIAHIDGKLFEPGNYEITAITQKHHNPQALAAELREYVEKNKNNPYAVTEDAQKIVSAIEQGRYSDGSLGRMYEVRIKADPEEFLDWDKPLAQQSEAVRKAIGPILEPRGISLERADFQHSGLNGFRTREAAESTLRAFKHYYDEKGGGRVDGSGDRWFILTPDQAKGQQVWDLISRREGSDAWSEALSSAGIKGIRYLDQGSRAEGKGTYNYVVFSDKDVEIVAKDGKPIAKAQSDDILKQINEAREAARGDVTARKGEPAAADTGGIRAYHVSRHDFDRFDASKVGTGEGQTAQGPGLYFWADEGHSKKFVGPGKFAKYRYEARLDVDADHLLDYNKPLSAQTDYVKERLQAAGIPLRGGVEHILALAPNPKEAADRLAQAGIPGARYGSGKEAAYIVFDDKRAHVVRKGEPAAADTGRGGPPPLPGSKPMAAIGGEASPAREKTDQVLSDLGATKVSVRDIMPDQPMNGQSVLVRDNGEVYMLRPDTNPQGGHRALFVQLGWTPGGGTGVPEGVEKLLRVVLFTGRNGPQVGANAPFGLTQAHVNVMRRIAKQYGVDPKDLYIHKDLDTALDVAITNKPNAYIKPAPVPMTDDAARQFIGQSKPMAALSGDRYGDKSVPMDAKGWLDSYIRTKKLPALTPEQEANALRHIEAGDDVNVAYERAGLSPQEATVAHAQDTAAKVADDIANGRPQEAAATIREAVEQAAGAYDPALRVRLQSLFDELSAAAQKAVDDMNAIPPAGGKGGDGTFDPKIADEIWDDKGQSYITRMWDKAKVKARYPELKRRLVDYFSEAQGRAQHVLDQLQKEAAVSVKPDPKLAKNIEDLREFTGLSRGDLEATAQNTISHIMGHPDGRLMFDLPPSVRGPLKARTLRIRDELIEDFLERDIELIGRFYTRTMAPDIEMVRMFGSLDMKETIAKIADEADKIATDQAARVLADKGASSDAVRAVVAARGSVDKAITDLGASPAAAELQKFKRAIEKETAATFKSKEDAIRDLTAVADRLRGTYAIPEDPTAFLPRLGRTVRTLNYLRLLGGMTLSAIPDVFRPLMVHGVTTFFRDGWVPLITNLKGIKLAGEEVKMAGTALDMVLDTRAMAIADVLDDFGRYSKFERALQSAQNNFGLISLMAPWNAALKQWTGMMTMTKIIRAAQRVADGTIGQKLMRQLAESSIDDFHARIIAQQFQKHGIVDRGVYLPNTSKWDVADPNVRNALEAFRAAVVRDVDRIIVTPGQDKPLWMSSEVGKVVGQVKSFAIASMQRTLLAGLQQRDAGVLSGALMMIAMGAVVEALRAQINQKEAPTTPAQWAATAIDRSGLTAYLYDVNHFTERMTGGAIGIARLTGKPVSRYASRNWADAIMGPTAGLLKDVAGSTSAISRQAAFGESVSENDIAALRRVLPYQNLFYMAWLFKQLEKQAGQAIGAKPSPQQRRN